MAPLPSSPAIDTALVTANSPAIDQRGTPRPSGAANELGALELEDVDGLVDGVGGVVTVLAYVADIDANGDGFVDGELGYGLDPAASNLGDLAPR
ncbi:MAG: hypothetical protein ACI9B9_000462 [Halioglobus sp.]|jgi:hypothetical protein